MILRSLLFATLLLTVSFAIPAHATVNVLYSEGFESFTLGDLNGQDGYSGGTTNWDVVDDVCRGGKCITNVPNTSALHMTRSPNFGDLEDTPYVYYEYFLRVSSSTDQDASFQFSPTGGFCEFDTNDNPLATYVLDCGAYGGVTNVPLTPNVWRKIQVLADTQNQFVSVKIDGFYATTSAPYTFNPPSNNIEFADNSTSNNGVQTWWDDIYIATSTVQSELQTLFDTSSSSSYSNGICSTCTRIISNSLDGETFASTSTSRVVTLEYYLSSSDASSYQKVVIDFSTMHYLYNPSVNNAYQNYFYRTIKDITASTTFEQDTEESTFFGTGIDEIEGTYAMYGHILGITITEAPWWKPWDDFYYSTTTLASLGSKYFVGVATTNTEIEEQRRIDAEIIAAQSEDDSLWERLTGEAVFTLTHTPPIGYATRIIEIFNATSTGTTSTMALTLSFPDELPAPDGVTVDLNVGTALQNALNDIDLIDETTFDTFMTYWRLLWYGILVFWIVKQILVFDIDFNVPERERLQWRVSREKGYQKSGKLKVRTLD